jgi:hypothetical protein
VTTGSHNFSVSASEKNDENLVIVRGNTKLAQAYALHVNGVYDHYSWRAYLASSGNPDQIYKPLDGWNPGGSRGVRRGISSDIRRKGSHAQASRNAARRPIIRPPARPEKNRRRYPSKNRQDTEDFTACGSAKSQTKISSASGPAAVPRPPDPLVYLPTEHMKHAAE